MKATPNTEPMIKKKLKISFKAVKRESKHSFVYL